MISKIHMLIKICIQEKNNCNVIESNNHIISYITSHIIDLSRLKLFDIIIYLYINFFLIIYYLTYLIFLVSFYNEIFESSFLIRFFN